MSTLPEVFESEHPELLSHIRQKKCSPVYVLQSEDDLLGQEVRDALLAYLRDMGYLERALFVQGASLNWQDILMELSSPSFFSEKRIYDIRLPEAKVGRDGGPMIGKIAALANQDYIVVISLPLDWQTKKLAWYKDITQLATVFEIHAPQHHELAGWLKKRLRRYQVSLEPEALQVLANYVDGNLLAAQQEIIKLAMLHGGETLSAETLEKSLMNVSRFGADDFREAFLQLDWARALRIIDRLQGEGESAVVLAWGLYDDIRKAMQVYGLTRQSMPMRDALRKVAVFGDRATQMEKFCNKVNIAQLYSIFINGEMVNLMSKGALQQSIWDEFRRICLALSNKIKISAMVV